MNEYQVAKSVKWITRKNGREYSTTVRISIEIDLCLSNLRHQDISSRTISERNIRALSKSKVHRENLGF